jgi:hypothetical protein
MKIAFESELMENQKHAVVMAPDKAFEVLQSKDGDALFFSIGTDNVFYLTREVTNTFTGWNKIDLSSALASQHGGGKVTAKTFKIAQNAQTLAIDIALVVAVSGVDYLYLSLGNANTDTSWGAGVTWSVIPFDAGTPPSPLTIADVLIMNIAGAENIFVDILRQPGDSLQLLDRYYITPGGSPQWNLHKLAADLAAGSISSCLGNRANDPIPGIYTFGTIANQSELLFTPQYNYFRPNTPPDPARLTLPTGASAIASALNSSGASNLFVAGQGGLFVFTPDNQHDQANPVQIVTDPVVAGANLLAAATNGNRTTVWGLDPQGNLFYVSCAAGSEGNASAWTNPVPLLPKAEGFAFYLNLNAGNSVLFAHVDGQNLVQLTQDAVTTDWLQRAVLLPSTSPDDMAVYKSFTTHIQVTDDNGVGSPNAAAALTATSPVSVYINDVYYLLSPTVPINVTADATGVLTVVQETQSLAAVCFNVSLTGANQATAAVNPMSKALQTLGMVSDGTSLGKVTVKNSDGTTQPLVPATVSSDDKDAAAKSLVNFVQISNGLPSDGSRQRPSARSLPTARAVRLSATPGLGSWGMSFANGQVRYHEGPEALTRHGLVLAAAPRDVGMDFAIAAGDFFNWLKNAFRDVDSFIVQEAEGVYHFLATIAGKVYDVLLDCVSAVVHAVEFVFNRIKVFFDDLIKWLGFLFEWKDILVTHKVLKKVLKVCAANAINQILNLEQDVKKAFDGIEKRIDAWAQIPSVPDTVGGYQSKSSSAPGYGSPQSNWALHHTKGNAASATTNYSTPTPDTSKFHQIFDDLKGMVDTEIDDIKTAITRIKTDVIDPIASLTAAEAMKKIAAIILDAILTTAENVIVTSLDLIRIVVEGIIDLLDAPIQIPILSKIYKEVAGDDLSFLDLVCLITAIPVTVIYKIAAKRAPFTQAEANALINIGSYDELKSLLTGPSPRRAAQSRAMTANRGIDPGSLLSGLTIVSAFAGMFGAFGVALVGALKKTETEAGLAPPAPLRYLAACLYLPYVAPDLIGAFSNPAGWGTILNDFVTIVAIGKTLADNHDVLSAPGPWSQYISPVAESLINLIWLVPAAGIMLAIDNPKTSDWLSFAGNMVFDLGGGITVGSEEKLIGDPKVAAVFFGVIEVLTVGYGFLCVGTGIALLDNS